MSTTRKVACVAQSATILALCLCSLLFTPCTAYAQASAPYTYADLHDFGGPITLANGTAGTDGGDEYGGVTFGRDGDMFGATGAELNYGDWPNIEANPGLIWKLSRSGVYTDLHDFGLTVNYAGRTTGPDGTAPWAGVTFDDRGNMFGTTAWGGEYLSPYGLPIFYGGVAWKLTASGKYVVLHDFGGTTTNANGRTGPDGSAPMAGIALDRLGNIFGTASAGGANQNGILWEITRAGAYLDLHDFGGTVTNANGTKGPDGGDPTSTVRW